MSNEQNESDTKAHPVDTLVMLEVWNHGLAGKVDEPCGETHITKISGDGIWLDFAAKLNDSSGAAYEFLGHLPTDRWLEVKARICSDDGELYLEVDSFSEMYD